MNCEIKTQSRDVIKTSTDILMFALPAAGRDETAARSSAWA